MIVLTGDENDMEISGLYICMTETRSTVGMNGLGVIGSSLHCEGTTKKGSTVDDNSVGTISLEMSVLEETGSSLDCDRCPQRH